MPKEIEIKFIEIDKAERIKKILELGTIKEYETDLQSQHFESEKLGLSGSDSSKKYLRVRTKDDKVFLTYKGPVQKGELHIREEIEIVTDSYDKTITIFEKLELKSAPIFQKKRTHFSLGEEIHFEIDEVPGIPPYLELETKTEKQMYEICNKLSIDPKKGHAKTIVEIYPEKFK